MVLVRLLNIPDFLLLIQFTKRRPVTWCVITAHAQLVLLSLWSVGRMLAKLRLSGYGNGHA